jgi:hypothetical protein
VATHHPHVEFFDRLARREDSQDPKLARLLCGVRDQILAASSGTTASSNATASVRRTLQFILSSYKDRDDLKKLLTAFLTKSQTRNTIL